MACHRGGKRRKHRTIPAPVSLALGVPLLAAIALTGCSGQLEKTFDGPGTGAPTPAEGNPSPRDPFRPAGPGSPGAADTRAASLVPVRLLTREEYNNTLEDLLGDGSRPADLFPGETAGETGFAKVAKLDEVNVSAYLDAAEAVAARAAADPAKLAGCDPASEQGDECVRSFVTSFGRRIYRRPLSEAEVAEHLALYRDKLRTGLGVGPREAWKGLLTAMLQSPFFLYRWELGWQPGGIEPDGALRLNSHHLASQLSYFLWASMPDPELFAAADRDELRRPEVIEAQARRMLKDARAERAIVSFHEQWLGVSALTGTSRDGRLYPTWGRALAERMLQEIRRLTTETILRGDGRLSTLLTTRATFLDGALATHYGVEGVTGDAFVPATLPAGQRAGILTSAAVMAAHSLEGESSPIHRGKFVREHVMCEHIPPPPGMIPDLPPPAENVPKKMRYAAHSEGTCKGCHEKMDPIGPWTGRSRWTRRVC
jgi:hypothetical protein